MSTYSSPPSLLPAMKPQQHLIMSPQMQQAIHLLQVPVMELSTIIELEMEQNPMLEYIEDDETEASEGEAVENEESSEKNEERELSFEDTDFAMIEQLADDFGEMWGEMLSNSGHDERDSSQKILEMVVSAKTSLHECLMRQVEEVWPEGEKRHLAEAIVGSIDRTGLLTTPLSEIAVFCRCREKALIPILEVIQTFEPSGVGARSIQEALLIQLKDKEKGDSLAYRIISDHYDAVLHNQIPLIAKALGSTPQQITSTISHEIVILSLYPGLCYGEVPLMTITPDVSLRIEGEDRLVVEVNDEYIPSMRLNRKYLAFLHDDALPKETREFIKQKVTSAKWLLRNILQRNDTIVRIVSLLAEKQREFLLSPLGKLKPLTMRMVADELAIHESTVARTVVNKYVDTPRGLLSLRSFFTNAYVAADGSDISADTVKQALTSFIDAEDPKNPYSDQQLSLLMQERGVSCARRTITKYRKELNIGTLLQRKKY